MQATVAMASFPSPSLSSSSSGLYRPWKLSPGVDAPLSLLELPLPAVRASAATRSERDLLCVDDLPPRGAPFADWRQPQDLLGRSAPLDPNAERQGSGNEYSRVAATLDSLGDFMVEQLDEALETLERLNKQGTPISQEIIHRLLQACIKQKDLAAGRRLHSIIVSDGLDSVAALGDYLIRLFASCGSVQEANVVFCKIANPSIHTWHAIISAHVTNGQGAKALELYHSMQQEGIQPNKSIFSCILKACGMAGDIAQGKLIHDQIIQSGLQSDVVINNTLIDMYAKCGSLEKARDIFDNLSYRDAVSWDAMIAGYAQHGGGLSALELFEQMQHEGIEPDNMTFASVLKACVSVGDIGKSKMIHEQVKRHGQESDSIVGAALVDMYAQIGSLEEACKVFNELKGQNVLLWNAMIGGYAQHGQGQAAVEYYQKMQQEGIQPDKATFLCVLKACGSIGSLGQGKLIHAEIMRSRLQSDAAVGSAIVDMYAKCGSMEEARKVFDIVQNPTVVSWGAMIAGYAHQGNSSLALRLFDDMQIQGLKPDSVMYTSVLKACSDAGKVAEGQSYFKQMREEHGLIPRTEHYNYLVDLLGRAGQTYETEELLESMPILPTVAGWMSLLTACRTYSKLDLGKRCFDQVRRLDPNNSASYIFMSNIYAAAKTQDNVEQIQTRRRYAGAWKKPGRSWIEVDMKVHEFTPGDKSHDLTDKIYAKLKSLRIQMKKEGYVPRLDLVLKPISSREKEDALLGHCEKLAIAFGLVSTPQGATVRVTKNLRVCADCHTASRLISRLEKREIIIRDTYTVHRFVDGECTCGDR